MLYASFNLAFINATMYNISRKKISLIPMKNLFRKMQNKLFTRRFA